MAALPSIIERDAWRLFDVDLRADEGGLGFYLDCILERCVDWFGASSASIFLRDGLSDDFRFVAGERSLRGTSLLAGSGIAGVVVETGQAVLVNDPGSHPLLKGRVKSTRRHEVSSSIVVPLVEAGGACIGVLNLSRATGKPLFGAQDLNRVQSIASQISLAVVNARLFAQVAGAVAESERANEKLQAVLKSLGIAVLVMNNAGRVTDWNTEAENLFSLDLDQWHCSLRDLEPRCVIAAIEESLVLTAGKGPRYRRAESSDGRSWSITVTRLGGGGVTATIVETTEHDRERAEMDRLKRMAEVGQMTAAIAHEIRNPLTGIRSAAQLIESSPEQAAELAGIIDQEVLKLNGLCEQFLEFARPLSLRIRPISLAQTCDGVAELLREEFSASGVSLEVEIEPNSPTILADALRLEQVVRNLLLNAMQACKAGGKVRMAIGGDWISVEDNGAGMSAETQASLFTPFFTTKPSGTGLGLSNLRKIIDAHGGKVTVTSELGQGTTFRIVLPVEVSA